jgi:ABC-type bacteriocin/lantibiotic exporter with double-glycine peptidase domain
MTLNDMTQNNLPSGFRWRPLRLRRAGWPQDDAGPLTVTEPERGWRWIAFGWRRYIDAPGDPRAPDTVIAMPYPVAAPGGLTPSAWIAPWRADPSPLKRALLTLPNAASMLPCLAPAIAALGGATPAALMLATGLALAGLLLRHAATLEELNRARTDSVGVHGRLWDRLLALPSECYARPPARLAADVDHAATAALVLAGLRQRALAPAVALSATLALLGALSVMVAAVAVAGLVAYAAAFRTLVARQLRATRTDAIATAALDDEAGFVARQLPRLRDLGIAQLRQAKLQDLAVAADAAAAAAERAGHAVRLARYFGVSASAVVVVAALPWLTAALTLRETVGVLLLAPVAAAATARLAELAGRRAEALRSIAAIDDLLRFDVDAHGGAFDQIRTVALYGVGYRHESGPVVLSEIDLTLRRGEVLALSGASGVGKSTLLRIVMGLVDPTAGMVTVNGRVLRATQAASYRARVAAVFQNEDWAFATVRNAIAAGRPGLTMAAIGDALADVGLLADILALPMGLQTLVIAGAFPQSFCHRLMIARSLAADADLLVFDETLTDLDPIIAKDILDAARRRGAAVIFATHKPALLDLADRIIALSPRDQPAAGGKSISDTQ